MTWKSSCSIASDDETSRQSFLSDCDSEFDLRPPPRYPAEKRSSILNKRTIARTEPPLTRSRAKATGKTLPSSPTLPKTQRTSFFRRGMNALSGLNTNVREDLQQNIFLFTKQESSSHERVPIAPLDGVNFLADRFENCSLDEQKINKSGVWPSRETHSHYIRPISSMATSQTFGENPFTTFNNTASYPQSGTPSMFGHHQAQLWSRFHFAASALRNDICVEQIQTSSSNLFTPNPSFHSVESSSTPVLPIFSPSAVMSDQKSFTGSLRQRKIDSNPQSVPVQQSEKTISVQQSSSLSKVTFTIMIFLIGLLLGYILTSTFPPDRFLELFRGVFRRFIVNLSSIVRSLQ